MMRTGRVEAFSDGVFAIAITLLVLDLAVPPLEESRREGLWAALGHEWPSYLAYLVSFFVVGIIWINHHTMLTLVDQVDRVVLFANLVLLLFVSVIPFPTRLLADYLLEPEGHVAAAIYSATMLAMGMAFSALWLTISARPRILRRPLDPATRRATLRRFGAGQVIYAAAVALSFVSAVATLALHGVLALYYCFDQLTPSGGVDET
ncbi:MAG TPA: TMEM175 family protein [Actinomycetospora sp.]|jgi:uncharacterized membrane protein|uniref:TMEM175 family protein n=1 Tax=Actinomycetospora sp. TaxID=1872135 RepID=UPI002F42052A